ncbi:MULTISPECIES: hypothetical protein [Lachnospiraceae]|jgi:uncharacterized coiled-coil protein SlyX|uniref:Uncharacterized protein n=1 Tax=Anaerobium acetethylicum TaxID=1619234 RepID=A0A1D3TSI0_9FIRM|nr:hypothetical protein [Anaerobium acetethylicum]MDD3034324.1 hypothetical protein [Bacteroidales bacterium]SCP96773.1 hypothetical protein SAMN05421730_100666 [Anaerobium acetethylicum]
MDNIRRGNILKEIKNANRFEDDVYLLVEEDLTFGLEKDQIDLYLKKNFKLSQMKVLSSYLRKGIDVEFVELVANHPELTGYQVQVALDFFQKGVPIATIESSVGNKSNVAEMKELFQSVLEKAKAARVGAEDAPAYVKEMMEQMAASIEKIQYQEQRYDELNKKLTIFESTKRDEEVRDNLLQKYNDAESLLNSQQNKLNQADSTIARLREQITDKEKEMKRMQTRIDTLEDKLLARADKPEKDTPVVAKKAIADSEPEDTTVKEEKQAASNITAPIPEMFTGSNAIPVYYQMPVVDAQGRMVQRVPVEKIIRKSETGVAALIGRLGFKKKSRQDIVKLVASGDLVPAQLIQIKTGMERGLTEGQLVELINNNVSAEKMKEIIEIAVLENSMDY